MSFFSRFTFLGFVLLLTFGCVFLGWKNFVLKRKLSEMEMLIDSAQKIENVIVQNLPTYQDAKVNEFKLRQFLNFFHLNFAKQYPKIREKDINFLLEKGELRDISEGKWYFYGVPQSLRYLRPVALSTLKEVQKRFQEQFKFEKFSPNVLLSVASALRTTKYQKNLRKSNMNATLKSSHVHGVSFDLFYEDFFVSLPQVIYSSKERRFLGYLLGDRLVSQFRAQLALVLLEMQNEGRLYVIYEPNQKVFHVTPQKKL